MKNIFTTHRLLWGWLLLPLWVLLLLAGCGKEQHMEDETPTCQDASSVTPLSGVWATPEPPTLALIEQCFLHQNNLIMSKHFGNSTIITALDDKSGQTLWQKSLPFIGGPYLRQTGDRLFYCANADKACSYFDLTTQTTHRVFQAEASESMLPLCAIMGDLVANVVYEADIVHDSLTVRIYLTDMRKGSSKQVDEMHYQVKALSLFQMVPLMDFNITATGDTLLCFMQYLGDSQSGSGIQSRWIQYQSIHWPTGKKNSGPSFLDPYYSSLLEGKMIFHEDRVYYATDREVVCLNAESAQAEWTANIFSPRGDILLSYVDGRLVACQDNFYYALNPATGDVLWSGALPYTKYISSVATSTDDYMLLPASNEIVKIDLTKGCILARYSNPYSQASIDSQVLISEDGEHLFAYSYSQVFCFKKPD